MHFTVLLLNGCRHGKKTSSQGFRLPPKTLRHSPLCDYVCVIKWKRLTVQSILMYILWAMLMFSRCVWTWPPPTKHGHAKVPIAFRQNFSMQFPVEKLTSQQSINQWQTALNICISSLLLWLIFPELHWRTLGSSMIRRQLTWVPKNAKKTVISTS